MKKIIAYIILLISLLANSSVTMAQETHVTGTLKVHPWLNLPVVISTDIKGGLQSLGTNIDFTGKTISEALNLAVPSFKREIGMVTTITDPTLLPAKSKTRYFEYAATDYWREIFVIYFWEANRDYAVGEYVVYDGNFYVANTAHTSSATFVPDLLKWNNAGGKDGKYTVTEMQMDGKTLNKVAINGSVVVAGTENNTIATVGYINGDFNGKRAVTRTGLTGISGVNFNTATLAEFLNKVFFPIRGPYVNYFRYNDVQTAGMVSYQTVDPVTQVTLDNVGTVTVAYATWSPLANFTFKYDIALQDPSPIAKVEIYNGATLLNTNVGNATVGSLTIPKSSSYTSLKLKITDSAANEVNLSLNTVFTLPLGVQITNVRLSTSSGGSALTTTEGTGSAASPWLIERTGSDLSYYLNWAMTKNNDANVTNINFTGPPTLTNLSGANLAQQTISPVVLPNSDASTVYHLGVSAKGDVAQVFSNVSYSAYYQLRDKLYAGFLPGTTIPTEAQILGLQKSSLSTKEYFSTKINPVPPDDVNDIGITLINSTGASGFFTWAVPTYSDGATPPAAFSRYTYAFSVGVWNPYSEPFDQTTYFVKTSGANATWYWVCIYKASTAAGNSVKALLQN